MKALGIIFSYSERENLRELTKIRTLASLPFGGKFRIIDFILSNFVNSGINDVSIITRKNFRSLADHLGSGKEWDLTRKRGGLRILSPLSNPGYHETGVYRGIIDALDKNMNSIRRSISDYVILTGSSIICRLDYQDLIRKHIQSNADITAVYTKSMNGSNIVPSGVAELDIDDQNRITGLRINQDDLHPKEVSWSLGTFVIKKSLLESLVADASSFGRYDFYIDIIQRLAGSLKIIGYEYKGHLLEISNVTGYMNANMNLLSEDFRNKVFQEPVYTKVKDSVPALYCEGCTVSNSIISDGCVIQGTVTNSIISRGVKIGKDSVINNCIIMQNTEVMRNVSLDYVILDKDVIVRENRQLSGQESYPVVIEKLSIL